MNGAGAGIVPPGQVTPVADIVRGRDLPDGTPVQVQARDAVEIFGEDRPGPGRATQAGEDSRGAKCEVSISMGIIHNAAVVSAI